jgi:2-methylisocitrate lyase-like PEP mutase family enzyme
MGFPALATTSAGLGFTMGRPDAPDALDVNTVIDHIAAIVTATDLPVSADFQAGYSADTDGMAANVARCLDTGVAGLSIEDAVIDADGSLYELPEAVERVAAARAAIDAAGVDVLLTARAECFLVDHPDPLRDAIRRLQAYADAGADVLYAPGPKNPADIRAIVEAVHPKPVNVLLPPGMHVGELAEIGVRRVSVGSALARAAWGAFLDSARELANEGTSNGLQNAVSFDELNALF